MYRFRDWMCPICNTYFPKDDLTKLEVAKMLEDMLENIYFPQMSPEAMRGFWWCYDQVEDAIKAKVKELRGEENGTDVCDNKQNG